MVQSLVEQGKLEEARTAKEELKNMQEQFDLLKDIMDPDGNGTIKPQQDPKPLENNSIKEFANAARRGFRNATMVEGTPADGGYTVPEDIQTQINTGFAKVGEGGKITAGTTPQFERISYEIEKYAGYFPCTNELLADTDANITGVLTTWIADESRVTRNKMILEQIATKDVTAMKDLDDIKKALNITLGQAFKPTSAIVTNDDGLQWLDTLKDNEGRYLLQPDPANPMQLRLCAGSTIVPVKVIPNSDMPSDTKTAGSRKIPVIIGDLKEGIKFWDRNQMTLMTSNIAQIGELNAFEEDLTIFRAIEREDCTVKDKEAFVNGQLTIKDATVTGV